MKGGNRLEQFLGMTVCNFPTMFNKLVIGHRIFRGVASKTTGDDIARDISFGIVKSINTIIGKLPVCFIPAICRRKASTIRARLLDYLSEFFFGKRKFLMSFNRIHFVGMKQLIERRFTFRESFAPGGQTTATARMPRGEVCTIYNNLVSANTLAQPGNTLTPIEFSRQDGESTILFTDAINKTRVPITPTNTSTTESIARLKSIRCGNLFFAAIAPTRPRCPFADVWDGMNDGKSSEFLSSEVEFLCHADIISR